MPRNSKPRKAHSHKAVIPPVTIGMVNEMIGKAHFFLMAAETGYFSLDGWKELTKVLMTASFSTDELSPEKFDRAYKIAIDSAVLTLKAISDREVRTGKWAINAVELAAVCRGVISADSAFRTVDYRKLSRGYYEFRKLVDEVK